MSAPAAFYCVSSAPYFLGAVGVINSLRLVGHDEPVHVLDCGLSPAQVDALSAQATVVPAPRDREPFTLKPLLPLAHPAEVMILIDADMIVTRSLAPLIETASRGGVVAFRNNAERFVSEWGRLLDLENVRRRPYVCSGLVVMGRSPGEQVLRLVDDRQGRVDFERSYFGRHDPSYPLLYADQDILNAVLASRVEDRRMLALEHRLAPMIPFEGLELVDEETLRCRYSDGVEPYLLHHSLSPKPWQRPGYDGVYTRLLGRLLTYPDVAVRVADREIPLALRRGALPATQRLGMRARARLRQRLGGPSKP